MIKLVNSLIAVLAIYIAISETIVLLKSKANNAENENTKLEPKRSSLFSIVIILVAAISGIALLILTFSS